VRYVALAAALAMPWMQAWPAAQAKPQFEQQIVNGIEIVHVRGPVYMLAGGGANVVVSVGRDGTLVVDSGAADKSTALLAAIRTLQRQLAPREAPLGFGSETRSELQAVRAPAAPPKPIRFVINTSGSADHVGGNTAIAAAGRTITGGNVAGDLSTATQAAQIIAHENVLLGMAKREPPAPVSAQPTDTYFTPYFKLGMHFNGEGIQLIHQPAAHADGDSLVWFRGSDVIATGDVFVMDAYPRIEEGGSINGIVDSLNNILDLAYAEFRLEGGTLIVPGHGRLSDSSDVAYYRDMLTTIRDRVRQMVEKGATLEQVTAAKPTLDYDPRFGSTSGPWTTDMFVAAVYRSLAGTP
jgi:cyclase